MPREDYQQVLADLRADVRAMGDLVRDRVARAIDALEGADAELAGQILGGDEAVNDLYLELERRCIDVLALHTPVAGDLRFVTASFKILTDLERIGDLAENFARYALATGPDRYPEVDVGPVGEDVCEMIDLALAAYEDEDTDACHEVIERDEAVDRQCAGAGERVVRSLIHREDWRGATVVEDVTSALLTVRDLERVGDHAVNVAARTLYAIDGDPEYVHAR